MQRMAAASARKLCELQPLRRALIILSSQVITIFEETALQNKIY
jgi:hypothetical protein